MMRFRGSVKLGLLIILSVCGGFLTLKIAGKKALGQAAVGKVGSVFTKTRVAPNGNQVGGPPAGAVPVVEIASFTDEALTVTAGARGVSVNASALIMDKRTKKSYMWEVLIRDEGLDNVISTVTYKDQTFSPPRDGKALRPTFNDLFPLPEGTYNIEVRLLDVAPPSEIGGDVHPTGSPQVLLSRSEKVVVGPR
jgi:hypothetical protein